MGVRPTSGSQAARDNAASQSLCVPQAANVSWGIATIFRTAV